MILSILRGYFFLSYDSCYVVVVLCGCFKQEIVTVSTRSEFICYCSCFMVFDAFVVLDIIFVFLLFFFSCFNVLVLC